MTYLLTGATGFIGKKLVKALLARGHSVNYLARKRSPELDSRAAFHLWNSQLEDPPLNSVPRHEVIIHLMGESVAQRWTAEVKARIRQSRIEATRKLVTGIGGLQHKPSVLISSSAVGYYGDRGAEVLTEASAPGSGFLAEVCAGWEREASRAREFGLRVASIRTATVLGRDGGALPKMLTPFRLGLGGKFGNGKQWMSWVHVDDLIRLFIFTSENGGASGPLNGASPNPVTNADFTKTLAQTLHRPAVMPMPKFALKLALGEMSDFLFDSLRVIPEAAQNFGFQFEHPKLDETLTGLVH